MKKILKNKKGFTLVELLAVIVILAIIMVIATQQIGKVIAGARADSFVESYQMIAKQVQTYIVSDQTDDIACSDDCNTKYGLSNDYSLTVVKNDDSNAFTITLGAADSGKFTNMNLTENGKASDGSSCDTSKIGRGATSCSGKQIVGSIAIGD